MSSETTEFFCDVAIIGAGFSGTMTAIHLLAENQPALSVALIEREDRFGQGVAYSTRETSHLLNVPAGKMSAFADRPSHFLDWLEAHEADWADAGLVNVEPSTFVPRFLYGKYVKELLADAEAGAGHLRRLGEEAVDVQPLLGGALLITLESRRVVRAGKVVLALGVFPPGDPPLPDQRFLESSAYLNTPWSADTHDRLAGPGDVLILGSGLTALDLLLTLRKSKQEGIIHVLSRRGLFPQPHRSGAVYAPFINDAALPKTVLEALRLVRWEIDTAARQRFDWRAVIDSLRPFTQAIWQNLDLAEHRRFLRHLRPIWEAHRHRAAPQALAVKDKLERAGRLFCRRGRLISILPTTDDGLEVSFRPTGHSETKTHRYRYVINCTGPECNYHKLTDPLIERLRARKLILADPLRLGLEVSPGGILNNGRGVAKQIFTLGSALKGRLLETTAVPELRAQAKALAETILADFGAFRPLASAGELAPDPAYEI
jgi:uncharacterized NAD(P)/FAD-binding protein YdhS